MFNLFKKKRDQKELEAIWVSGFSSGFEKAWDLMAPMMSEAIEKGKDAIRRQAIDESLKLKEKR